MCVGKTILNGQSFRSASYLKSVMIAAFPSGNIYVFSLCTVWIIEENTNFDVSCCVLYDKLLLQFIFSSSQYLNWFPQATKYVWSQQVIF